MGINFPTEVLSSIVSSHKVIFNSSIELTSNFVNLNIVKILTFSLIKKDLNKLNNDSLTGCTK